MNAEPLDDAGATEAEPPESHAYDLFILVLTVMSLIVMVVMLWPWLDDDTLQLLQFYDNAICVIFLCDFAMRMRRAHPKSDYFIGERGWLDLLGSIPSLGLAFRYTGILRLARLSRLARITRLMRGTARKEITRDVLDNRSRYAVFITVLTTFLVLGVASVMVLQFESDGGGSIETGWEAFWYSMVTITTVGYGDYSPITVGGRITAMFIMVAGMGIIGALASILASLLVGGDSSNDSAAAPDAAAASADSALPPTLGSDVAEMKAELAAMRATLERLEARQAPP